MRILLDEYSRFTGIYTHRYEEKVKEKMKLNYVKKLSMQRWEEEEEITDESKHSHNSLAVTLVTIVCNDVVETHM